LKMAANSEVQESNVPTTQPGVCNMEAVQRISKLPVVESTLQTATSIYEKVKDYNSITNWTFSTAESTVNKAIEVGKPLAAPVVSQLGGPIKKVDDMLCTGLDYVEDKIPAVKLPPGELFFQMYTNTKEYVDNTVTPAVQHARAVVEPAVLAAKQAMEPAVLAAKQAVEPAVQAAKTAVEPCVQSARQIAEPLVQPALEKAYALKEYGTQKVEELLHRNNQDTEADKPVECADCQETAKSGNTSPQH
ncbi:hypothetical protein ILUMI_11485, partial [Ignelater luminosus]